MLTVNNKHDKSMSYFLNQGIPGIFRLQHRTNIYLNIDKKLLKLEVKINFDLLVQLGGTPVHSPVSMHVLKSFPLVSSYPMLQEYVRLSKYTYTACCGRKLEKSMTGGESHSTTMKVIQNSMQ